MDILAILDNFKNEIITSIPGIINSFDSSNQTCSVQPAIKTPDAAGKLVNLPVLTDIPVIYPCAGDYCITFPLKPGDEVLINVCYSSIENWLSDGGIVDPQDYRHFDLSDAVVIPGLNSDSNAISSFSSTDLEIRSRDGSAYISLKSSGQININNHFTVDK